MTLPIQPLCSEKTVVTVATSTTTTAAQGNRRRPNSLSVAWVETPSLRRERRRAIYSWSPSIGYGTLDRTDERISLVGGKKGIKTFNRDVVPEQATLLNPLSLRLGTSTSSLVLSHSIIADDSVVKGNLRRSSRPRIVEPLLTTMPGIKTLWRSNAPLLDSVPSPFTKAGWKNGNNINNEAVTLVMGLPRTQPVPAQPTSSLASLRKCETVLTLTGYLRSSSSSSSIEPLQPINRLRVSPHTSVSRMCSRCSSLLTLASSSRYSLNSSTGGFVHLPQDSPLTLCKLCLVDVPAKNIFRITGCGCGFCIECMKAYIEFEIKEGAYEISCPDAQCSSQGVLEDQEIERTIDKDLLEKYKKYRLNREVELDKSRTWCPRAGCETICSTCPMQVCAPQSVFCPTCSTDFCSNCKMEWHEGMNCDEYAKQQGIQDQGIPFDSDLIKCCPMCNVPIEKDEGCAQMMCKRCKHVFCWYCLASLDDDFLLRHYDKGPCKNKLGHSRASVIWHRTQVIGIFAGFGILLLVASPLLLLAAPCIVCCKCRFCNTEPTKLDNEDEVLNEQS